MSTKQMEAELLGRETSFEYSETWVGYALLSLRLVMGWTLFYAGIDKLMVGDWTAKGYLMGAATREGSLFQGFWHAMATDYIGIVDVLNVWGLTLVGLALLLGVLVRWSAFWGAVMMLFYYFSSYPLTHSFIIDDHIVYAVLLFGLGAFGAGRILGLDEYIEDTEFVQNNPTLRYLLG